MEKCYALIQGSQKSPDDNSAVIVELIQQITSLYDEMSSLLDEGLELKMNHTAKNRNPKTMMRESIPNNRYVSNTFLEFSDLTQHLDKFISSRAILGEGLEDIAQFISNTLDIGECKIYGLQNSIVLKVSFVEKRESADMECCSLLGVLLDIMESYSNGNIELYHGNERT